MEGKGPNFVMFHTHGVVFLCVCERVIRAAPWVLRDKKGGKERKTGPHHGPVGVVKGPGGQSWAVKSAACWNAAWMDAR